MVRNAADGQREVANLLWGMPTPLERVKGKADYGTTNSATHNTAIGSSMLALSIAVWCL
ncbi:hypothetical protein X731_27495 [Mesorhizobium sp. L2C054A000]|nr:hypothetical protein X731_27495 [Mesorhizobium sp. L2C054A000]